MVRNAYGGAHFVLMDVSKIWSNLLGSNRKLLFFKINSIDSRINFLVKRCGIKILFSRNSTFVMDFGENFQSFFMKEVIKRRTAGFIIVSTV